MDNLGLQDVKMPSKTWDNELIDLRRKALDISYKIDNPTPPYNEWFDDILLDINDLNNLRLDSDLTNSYGDIEDPDLFNEVVSDYYEKNGENFYTDSLGY